MRFNFLKSRQIKSGLAASVLVLASGAAFAQQAINLSAGPATKVLPDGTAVPMWGYSCGAVIAGSTATCAPLNPTAAGGWSPVVITVPTGALGGLQINLTNNLSFLPTGATTANTLPTSLTIVGQLGGGLGKGASYKASPNHAQLGATWPTVNTAGGGNATFTPPSQQPRVQSFATEVAAGATTNLAWGNLNPGTYLIESGTPPSIQGPMGLYGILVVPTAPTAAAPAGCAYPDPASTTGACLASGSYNAEVPLLLSEIDPIQNTAVQTAVSTAGFSETSAFNLRDNVASVAPTAGGAGYQVGDNVMLVGGGGAGATAQVATVDATGAILTVNVLTAGSGYYSAPVATPVSTGTGATLQAYLSLSANTLSACSGGAAACYPPAVNYTPLYYLINGVAFDKTNSTASLFPALTATTPVSGNMLVRLVNAGLRMHVPSIVGSTAACTPVAPATPCIATGAGGFALIAEDGKVQPGVPRVQSEVFMAAGKTYDVMINAPAACVPVSPATSCTTPALPIYDRELSLSGNAFNRDAGMLAYIGVNGGTPPGGAGSTAVANPDTYKALVAGQTLTVSDPSKGVIANDVLVYGVTLLPGPTNGPTNGTVILAKNGTFTYTPSGTATTSDTFTYCANGTVTG